MQIISFFQEQKFILYNVNSKKMPVLLQSSSWSKITYKESLKQFDINNKLIGFRTGIQGNGKYIIGLDFDMWFKVKGDYKESPNTIKLYKEFENVNKKMAGLYTSSTERNRGCLVDITASKKIIKLIEDDGRRKLQKKDFHLEILANFNMVLPPSITKCKITGQLNKAREFMSDNYLLEVKQDTEIEEFIIDYLKDCVKKDEIPKSELRSIKAKESLLNFEDKYIDNEIYIKNAELLKPFIDNLDIDRTKNYDNWFKIGMAILNSYGKDGYNLFLRFSKKDRESYNEDSCNKNYNKKWLKYKEEYVGLNINYIINCVKKDNPERFISLLMKYEIEKTKYEFNEKKEKLELQVRKILQPAVWIMKHRKTGKWDYCDTTDISHCYSELKDYGKNFINEYINNCNEKNYYDFIDFIPDESFTEKQEKESLKTFNMFKGFSIKNNNPKTVNENKKKESQTLFINHLKMLCNNEELPFQMVLQWICHLVFKTTKRCGISIILKGSEGTGKTTLYNIIEKLIGEEYCYSTARPEHTMFCRFNDVLQEKIFVNINEPEFNSFKNGLQEFKSYITDKDFSIESKNKPKINLSNYMWFLITTNNDRLFTLSHSDRRFYFIETSNEKIGDTKYFKSIYDMLEDKESMYYIYEYCKEALNIDYDFTYHQKNSKTDFHNILSNVSKNPFYDFLQDIVEMDENFESMYLDINNSYIVPPKDFNARYKKYCSDLDISYMENGKTIKMKLQKISNGIHTKINNKSSYKFTKTQIINYLKVNNYYTNNE